MRDQLGHHDRDGLALHSASRWAGGLLEEAEELILRQRLRAHGRCGRDIGGEALEHRPPALAAGDHRKRAQPGGLGEGLVDFVDEAKTSTLGGIGFAGFDVREGQGAVGLDDRGLMLAGQVAVIEKPHAAVRDAATAAGRDGHNLSRAERRAIETRLYAKSRSVEDALNEASAILSGLAAGAGVVRFEGRKGGYGNHVEIRHQGGWATTYSHMSRFAPGVHVGSRVAQGQLIGYVGSTGLATGPHLHYEIEQNGRKVNPKGAKIPQGSVLGGRELAAFKAQKSRIDGMLTGAERQQTASAGRKL